MFVLPPWLLKIKEFFRDRRGLDALGWALLVLALVCRVVGMFVESKIVPALMLFFLALFVLRALSKNLSLRDKENEIFVKFFEKCKKLWEKSSKSYNDFLDRRAAKATHVFPKCPACKTRVRVPKGKGKIRITCPYCKNKFEKKV